MQLEKDNLGRFKKGYIPWNKGRKGIFNHSKKTKDSIRKKNKGKHYSPETEYKKGNISWTTGKHRTKKTRKKIGIGRLKRKKRLGYINSPKTRENMSKTQMGREPWNKGKSLSKSHKENLSKSGKGRTPWNKGKTNIFSKETIKRIREARKKQKFPNHHTQPELKFINLIKKYKLPFKYTGDGKFWIENINPDFVDCNGRKICIEVFGDYWHNPLKKIGLKWNNTEIGRKKILSKYGWRCLVLWEHELKTLSDDRILNKIKKFINSKNSISKYL